MNNIVRELDYLYGFGFANVVQNPQTGEYQGRTSRGDTTAHYEKLSDCLRKLWKMGYKVR